MSLYSKSIQSNVEIAISGFCPKSHQPFIAVISPIMEDGMVQYKITYEYSLNYQMLCVLLGDHKDEFSELLFDKIDSIEDISDYKHWRTPISTLFEVIQDNRYDSIGGGIQLSTIDNEGNFTSMGFMGYLKDYAGITTYRNIDLYSTLRGTIGECLITMPAIFI